MSPRTDARARTADAESGEALDENFSQSNPKSRTCLRCQTVFRSEWAGERVCPKCKHSSTWRSGQPTAAPPTGRR